MKKLFLSLIFIFSINLQSIDIKRAEVYWVDFNSSTATEIKKIRPAVIISNDKFNKNSSRVCVIPITSQKTNKINSCEVLVDLKNKKGKILCDQITTVDKSRIKRFIDKIDVEIIKKIEDAMKIVLFG